jgi:hypothetical protein
VAAVRRSRDPIADDRLILSTITEPMSNTAIVQATGWRWTIALKICSRLKDRGQLICVNAKDVGLTRYGPRTVVWCKPGMVSVRPKKEKRTNGSGQIAGRREIRGYVFGPVE